jgi:hypothetical protein
MWKLGGSMADSQLLRAEEALVPFDLARQADLDALDEWLDDPQWPQAVRLITGAGGLGKSRLALELCRQAVDWHAGLLDTSLEPKDMAAAWRKLRTITQPLLIVIDYAETRQAVLLALVKAMLQSPSEQRVRILLLARDAGEWWDRLPSKDVQCEAFLNGYATSGPVRLSALHDSVPDRRGAYQKALAAFAERFRVDAPTGVPELESDHFGLPLYLQMAALLALHGERPISAEGLTKALLNHETRYWRGLLASFNWAEPDRLAAQLLALTTLAGGLATPKEAHRYWIVAMGRGLSYPDFAALFHALAPLYPGRQGLQSVRPDLLGEALVAQVLLRSEATSLLDSVLSQSAAQSVRRNALTVLAHLSAQRAELHEILVEALVRHFAHCTQEIVAVATETTGQLSRLAEIAFTRLPPATQSQVTGMLTPLLRDESVQLAQLQRLVTGYLTEKWRQRQTKKSLSSGEMASYAQALVNHSIALARIGNNDEALQSGRESLNTYKQLVSIDHQRYDPGYATSLSNYACYLDELGRSDEAVAHAKEALEIRRRLAQTTPDRYDSDYATSLNNYAKYLNEVGRSDEAVAHATNALEICRRLAQTTPDRYNANYAMSLDNYATYLSAMGQTDDAEAHAKQALEIRRRLAQARPDRYDSDYARSLSNYANRLADVGRSDEAVAHAKQALEIRRRLAQTRPDRYDSDYARSLSNYAINLSAMGQSLEALEHATQAVEIFERLAQARPDRFDDERFNISYSMYFLSWLCDRPAIGRVLLDPNSIPDTIRPHRRPVLIIYVAFLQGCLAADEASRAEAFTRVHSDWSMLPLAGRIATRQDWLCAAAWCAKSTRGTVAQVDWKAEWRSFVMQRHGHIPHWMLEVAQRLAFQWPDVKSS